MARSIDLHAEIPLLVYLTCITTVLSLVIYTIYWLLQPTVLPNPGLAAYKPLVPTFILQERAESAIPEMERTAIAAAAEANAEQGIAPLRAFAAGAQLTVATRAPAAQETTLPTPKQAKQKRVVRVQQRQQVAQDPWQAWSFAQRSYGGWDGFQSGARSRWAGGRSSF